MRTYTRDEVKRMLKHAQPHKDLEGNILFLSSTMKKIIYELLEELDEKDSEINSKKDLVNEVKQNRKTIDVQHNSFMGLLEENKRLREALKKMSPNKYSSEEEMLDAILGTQVTASHVISPIDLISADSSPIKKNIEKSVRIKISREALGLNKQPGKTYKELVELQKKALEGNDNGRAYLHNRKS